MDREQAKSLIINTFENKFKKDQFVKFIANLCKKYNSSKTFTYSGNYIPEAYSSYVQELERIGQYTYDDKEIDLLIVNLKKETSLERARSMQRNFIARYLKGSRGGKLKDAALVAFVSPDSEDWRFSLVKMDYRFEETPSGKIKVREEFTPAKRWSFLVGKNEKSHTAQSRFIDILEDDDSRSTLEDLEQVFNVEVVTKEFFIKYRDLFIRTKLELDKIVQKDKKVKQEFENKNINTVDFAKKLLGQIVFLYFLQKKGWFGVEKGKEWGTGPRNFMRKLFYKEFGSYKNFYNDILEPLFFEALRTDRSVADHYYSRFNCKVPFLNGGLFDPINNFDWVNTDILIPNELFSNQNKTREGDIGDGILDVFDRYNFTVNEEEPLEKEVALDPELLGKIYEKLNAIRVDNFDEYVMVLKSDKKGEETKFNKEYGVYYTPREIVHYMCQQSLISYLESSTGIPACDIEKFVKFADLVRENEVVSLEKEEKIKSGEQKTTRYESQIPESIKQNAEEIDNLLANIKVCDPAVGSGAFPIGMMHEIVKLRQLISVYSSTGILACENSNTNIPVCENNDLHITYRNLPHWTKSGSIYWVTFRLADSLPKEKINKWKEEYEIWSKRNPKPWNKKQWNEYNEKFGDKFNNWLDAGYGSCILTQPVIREKVKECIMKFDSIRLKIHAVVIMPNHVHLLIEPFTGYSLSEILKGIKGASAKEINNILGTTGKKVWMEESYDHIIRSEKEYYHFIQYINDNPVKANLAENKYWLYVAQSFLTVNEKDQPFLPANVTQSFLTVDIQDTNSSLPVGKAQTGMSVLPFNKSQTGMSVLPYYLKRHCIENSLYGVDIDPGAIEICKLRFWLSLVVDEKDFNNIKSLPNLDYKVICGDSLSGVEKDLFNQKAFNKLEQLKHNYFNETNSLKKQELKNEIDKLIFEITKGHTEFDYEVYYSEVFHEKGGFDVVIANPPYIQLQKDGGKLARLYENQDYQTFARTGDIYVLFYEKGIKLLKENGILCYITSNKWMRAGYGEKLRQFFTQHNPLLLIDLGPDIFENATVDTNILLIQKRNNQNNLKAVTLQKTDKQSIAEQVEKNSVMLEKLTKDAWFIGSSAEQRLKEKIERIGKPLKDWDVNIYYGIKTGLNEAFIISTEKRNEILSNCRDKNERKRTEAIIKPILRGRDIKRYYYEWAGLWVIGTFPALRLNIDDYPAIKKYFLDNFDIRQLEQSGRRYPELGFNARKKTGNKWFETQDQIAYYSEFEKEKVVWTPVNSEYSFTVLEKGIYFNNSIFMITDCNVKLLCAILNSKLIRKYMEFLFSSEENYTYGSKENMEKIPLPLFTSENQPIVSQIEALVGKILAAKKQNPQADTSHWEREIDELVYQLYGLTEEEVKIIEERE